MLNPKFFQPIVYATSVLLLIAGIIALAVFMKDSPYFLILIGGYVVLIILFLSLKLYFVRLLLKPREPQKPQG